MAIEEDDSTFDPNVFLSLIGIGRTTAKYCANQTIFSQGDAADAIYYLQKGNANVTVLSQAGKEAVLATLGPGDFFGEGCLSGEVLRLATVTATTECAAMRLEKAAMIHALGSQPKLADLFITHLLARTSRVEKDLVAQLFDSSETRLAKVLLRLANIGKQDMPEPVVAKINQDTLAKMVGTTRSRVNFFMNKFRRLGLIEYNGDLRVHRSLLNIILHDGPPHDDAELD